MSILALVGSGLICVVNSDTSDAATSYTVEISSGDSSWSGSNASTLISDLCYAFKSEPLLSKNLSSGYIGFGSDEVAYEFYFKAKAGGNTYYPTSITYTSSKMSVVFSLPTSGTYTVYLDYYLMLEGGSMTEANMQAITGKDTSIELKLRKELWNRGVRYRKNCKTVYGHPDLAFIGKKVAVFCDSEFWHGYDWENRKDSIHTNREFWIQKIEHNMERDIVVNQQLESDRWIVIRFWGKDIDKDVSKCADIVMSALY